MIPNPVRILRRLTCRRRGHDPFPWNAATRSSTAVRCWHCGDIVNPRRVKVRR